MQSNILRKAEGYIRVSGKTQADNFSLRSQEQERTRLLRQ